MLTYSTMLRYYLSTGIPAPVPHEYDVVKPRLPNVFDPNDNPKPVVIETLTVPSEMPVEYV
jgi:hypothetical protein